VEKEVKEMKAGNFIFLLDRSHSMGGSRLKTAIKALIYFLKSLPVDSMFQVISFGTGFDYMLN